MATTLREVVAYLKARGADIEFKERPDGSLRIVRIDGVKFTGSEGNNKAREKAGMEMTAAQKEQRRKAGKESVTGHTKKTPSLSKRERLAIRKENAKRRRAGLEGIHAKQAREAKKIEGNLRGYLKRSKNARYHAAGYAYRESIEHDIQEIEDDHVLEENGSGVLVDKGVKYPNTLNILKLARDGKIAVSDTALYQCRQMRYNIRRGASKSVDGSITIEALDEKMARKLVESWKELKKFEG